MNDLKNTLTNAASSLRKGASGLAEDLQGRAQDACGYAAEELKRRSQETWDSVQGGTKDAVRQGSSYLLAHPWLTALGASGAGFILGICFHHRHADATSSAALPKMLSSSRGVLLPSLSFLFAAGALLTHCLSYRNSNRV
jgi:ElaB/YqjD/DUF883 family membrane-anchored ribosome-binding protein